MVGDGGASWRMKALRRAQAQAAEEGSNLSEVRLTSLPSIESIQSACTWARQELVGWVV